MCRVCDCLLRERAEAGGQARMFAKLILTNSKATLAGSAFDVQESEWHNEQCSGPAGQAVV